MIEPRIQYVPSADGTQIAYTTIGAGPPVVVAANAWGDIHIDAAAGPFRLPNTLREGGLEVTVYDGRGSGSSDRDVSDMSLAARLADLEAVVDRLAPERFALVAVVHGGATAVAYAAKHPHRVTRMALFAPYGSGADYYTATPVLRAIRALSNMAEEHWEFFTLSLANWMLDFKDAVAAERVAEMYRSGMNPRDYLSLIEACVLTDVTDLLPKVKAPTLIIRDSSSVFTMVPGFTRRVASAIPGAQAVTIDGRAGLAPTILGFLKGEEPTAAQKLPAATVVTVLFTDIVGHTEMMRRLGDARGRDVLREHEQITREVLKTHSGTEVKTMGDGFMASFGSVTKAVECAVALQKAFDERNRGVGVEQLTEGVPNPDEGVAVAQPLRASVEPVTVRVGLNAGEPIEDDGDLFGSSVILASRIAAKAQGGEILASMAVRELCAGKGFAFADLGDHELRGFEDPVRVFEVKWRE